MSANHTPGPWKRHVGRGAHPRFHIQTEAGYQIASTPEISRHKPEQMSQEANARIIAAAPMMLSALRLAELVMAKGNGLSYKDRQEAHEACLAAIAKAEGGGA